VAGARVLLVDHLIASGGTLIRAARAALAAGADSVRACAAHGLFSARDAAALTEPAPAGWRASDSVAPPPGLPPEAQARLQVSSAAPVVAELVARLHADSDVSGLTTGPS
jgi:ribose-phosphate pyrophosphokinase